MACAKQVCLRNGVWINDRGDHLFRRNDSMEYSELRDSFIR
jgi:hypothetical protein